MCAPLGSGGGQINVQWMHKANIGYVHVCVFDGVNFLIHQINSAYIHIYHDFLVKNLHIVVYFIYQFW